MTRISPLRKFQLTDFQFKVLSTIKSIPSGKITTYQILARKVGKPTAVRAVANALNVNPLAIKFPCHRVVRSSGQVGGYANGSVAKIKLLKAEGIDVKDKKIINFEKKLYHFK